MNYNVTLLVNGQCKEVKVNLLYDIVTSGAMCGQFDRKACELVDEDYLRRIFSTRHTVLYVEKM